MKKLLNLLAVVILLAVAATACEDQLSDVKIAAPEQQAPASGNDPDGPGPDDGP